MNEDELRRALGGTDAPNTLDARAIVARARARRLPRQIAAGSFSALALAGVTVLSVQALQPTSPAATTMAGESYDQSAPASPELDAIKRAPADRINFCTAALAEVAGSAYGLQLDVIDPVTAPAGTAPVAATVRLTNTSDDRVVGSTASLPAITLSQDGVVLWHSNGPADTSSVSINLAPGTSIDYTTTFTPVRCDVVDDEGEAFRADLPAVEPGAYALSALIDFAPDASMAPATPELDLVAGPLAPLTIG